MFKKIINSFYRNENNISINEMLEMIKTNENVILLDVRSKQEYREGHIRRKHKYSSIWVKEGSKRYVARYEQYNHCIL